MGVGERKPLSVGDTKLDREADSFGVAYGRIDELRRYVDADHIVTEVGQSDGFPPSPASDVEKAPGERQVSGNDFGLTSSESFVRPDCVVVDDALCRKVVVDELPRGIICPGHRGPPGNRSGKGS